MAPPKHCSVPECANTVRARGMCEKHYRRLTRTGSLLVQNPRNHCSMQGCREPLHARGYCDKHYQVAKNHGVIKVQAKAPKPYVCTSCSKPFSGEGKVPYKGQGLCRPCYRREWDVEPPVDEDVMILFERMKDTGLTKKEILKMLRVYGKE